MDSSTTNPSLSANLADTIPSSPSSPSYHNEAADAAIAKRYTDTLNYIQRVKDRHAYCLQVPLFFAIYFLFAVMMMLHSDVERAYDVGNGISSCAGIDRDTVTTSLVTLTDIYNWLGDTVLPLTLGYGENRQFTNQNRLCDGTALLIGGVRLSQWRRGQVKCPLTVDKMNTDAFLIPYVNTIDTSKVTNSWICYKHEVENIDDLEDTLDNDDSHDDIEIKSLLLPFGLLDVAAQYNISSAFYRQSGAGGSGTGYALSTTNRFDNGYHVIFSDNINSNMGLTNALTILEGLVAARWIDAGSGLIEVALIGVSMETSRIVQVLVTFERTSTIRMATNLEINTLPLHAYVTTPGVAIIDIIIMVYALGSTLVLLYKLGKNLFGLFISFSPNGFSPLAILNEQVLQNTRCNCWSSLWLKVRYSNIWTLSGMWRFIITYGSVATLLISMGAWWNFLESMSPVRTAFISIGVMDSATGSVTETTRMSSILGLHALLDDAIQAYRLSFAMSIAALTFLTIQAAMYMQLQPLMALVAACLRRALGDMLHLGSVLALIMFAYGVAGHVVFGGIAPDWATISSSSFTLVRMFAAWDYDLVPMQNANPAFAAVFIGSFMFLVANALIWIWFTVVIESYTSLRTTLKDMGTGNIPGFFDDFNSGLSFFGKLLASLCSIKRMRNLYKTRQQVTNGHELIYTTIQHLQNQHNLDMQAKHRGKSLQYTTNNNGNGGSTNGTVVPIISAEANDNQWEETIMNSYLSSASLSSYAAPETTAKHDALATIHMTKALTEKLCTMNQKINNKTNALPIVSEATVAALLQAYETCDDDSGNLQRILYDIMTKVKTKIVDYPYPVIVQKAKDDSDNGTVTNGNSTTAYPSNPSSETAMAMNFVSSESSVYPTNNGTDGSNDNSSSSTTTNDNPFFPPLSPVTASPPSSSSSVVVPPPLPSRSIHHHRANPSVSSASSHPNTFATTEMMNTNEYFMNDDNTDSNKDTVNLYTKEDNPFDEIDESQGESTNDGREQYTNAYNYQ